MAKASEVKAHVSLVIVNLIYGANFSIAKEVMPYYVKPFAFVLMRVAGALLLFWLITQLVIKEKLDKKDFPRVAVLGICGVALNQMLFLKGLSITTPINGAIIMVSTPIIVLILSAVLLKEKISANKVIGIIFGISGALLLLLFNKKFSFGSHTVAGDLMILVNAISWAFYVVLVKPLMHKYNTLTIIKWVFLFGLIYILPFSYKEFTEVNWNSFTTATWWQVSFVVIAVTFFAYILNTYALRALTPSAASIYIYAQPFIATLIAVFFGKDELDLRKIVSAILIVIGVYLVSKQPQKKLQNQPSSLT